MKKNWSAIISVVILLLFAAYHFSYTIAALFTGYPISGDSVIFSGTNPMNHQEYRIVAARDKEHNYTKLALFKKSKPGIWYLEYEDTGDSMRMQEYYLVSEMDSVPAIEDGRPKIYDGYVLVMVGNNAVRKISLSGVLPQNATGRVLQGGNHYEIVIVQHDLPDAPPATVNLTELLKAFTE